MSERGSKELDLEEGVETPRIVERFEEYAPVVRTPKMARFFNSGRISFRRSRAPSPESVMREGSEGEPGEFESKPTSS